MKLMESNIKKINKTCYWFNFISCWRIPLKKAKETKNQLPRKSLFVRANENKRKIIDWNCDGQQLKFGTLDNIRKEFDAPIKESALVKSSRIRNLIKSLNIQKYCKRLPWHHQNTIKLEEYLSLYKSQDMVCSTQYRCKKDSYRSIKAEVQKDYR